MEAKSAHSSYNRVQGELGWWGLLIFSGIIYTCFHSLARARTADENEERVRRMLFCAILTYAVSGWMIEFAFRAIFFVTVGMISAFHRILMDRTPSYSPEKDAANREDWGGVAGIKNSKLALAGATPEFVPAMTAQDYVLQRKAVRGATGRPRQFLAAQTGLAVATAGASVPSGYVAPVKDETGTYSPELSGLGAYLGWVRFRWYDIGGVYLSFRLALYIRDYAISL